jgi:hypothetical protein
LKKDFPFGMDQAYLTAVSPSAVLRTWASGKSVSASASTHSLDLEVQFDGIQKQTFGANFSTVASADSDDNEFSFLVQSFTGFNTLT